MADERGARKSEGGGPCVIGRQVTIRGSVSGSEDLVVQGRVEGTVTLQNRLVVEPSGVVEADVEAQDVTVHGELRGDLNASSSVSLAANARVDGNIRAGRVIIEDGARFRGSVEMDVPLPEGVRAPR